MTEPFLTTDGIRSKADAFREAVRSNNEQAGMDAIADLVLNAMIDLRRVADALQELAKPVPASG